MSSESIPATPQVLLVDHRVRAIRTRLVFLNLTQRELAAIIGVDATYLSRSLRLADPPRWFLQSLSWALGWPLDLLCRLNEGEVVDITYDLVHPAAMEEGSGPWRYHHPDIEATALWFAQTYTGETRS